jgi:tetratricopeptide (TPR) repeat protein
MGHEALADRGDVAGAMNALRKLVKSSPNDVALRHKMVEYAVRLKDPGAKVAAWLELAETFERMHQPDKARPIYQQVLTVDAKNARALQGLGQAPKAAAAGGDFVDLGSLLLGDDEEKTTRFVVAYEEPSGDEQADFAKMLSQFRAKVAENMGADDVKGHLDLGTAYKEMGLVDEAISEFQQALRASANSLPAYELLGQCFMDKGEPDAAVRTLKRALDAPREVEDELLGIYYWLGRAYQQIGNKGEAVEFYDRVFSLDINFADVTERLRALR